MNQYQTTNYFKIKVFKLEFPLCISRLRTQCILYKDMVRSLVSFSGLWIWHCHKLWCRSQMRLRSGVAIAAAQAFTAALIPSLAWEFPYAARAAIERKKRKAVYHLEKILNSIKQNVLSKYPIQFQLHKCNFLLFSSAI